MEKLKLAYNAPANNIKPDLTLTRKLLFTYYSIIAFYFIF